MKDMNKEHIKQLSDWLTSYKIDELLDENGKLKDEYASLAPKGERRMSANPVSNYIFFTFTQIKKRNTKSKNSTKNIKKKSHLLLLLFSFLSF